MRHKKLYKKTGEGVILTCDGEIVASAPHRGTNWTIDGCSRCGMHVRTIGCSPETDKIEEYE